MLKAGQPPSAGDLLLSGDSEGTGITQRSAEKSSISGVFPKKLEEGKSNPQALICIARRLVNIVYGMLKNHTEYQEPER